MSLFVFKWIMGALETTWARFVLWDRGWGGLGLVRRTRWWFLDNGLARLRLGLLIIDGGGGGWDGVGLLQWCRVVIGRDG